MLLDEKNTKAALEFKNEIRSIPIKDIEKNKFNPRKKFGQAEEDELIESIKSKGVLQPVIVYKSGDKYVLLDGERRFEACKKLGISEIPAHILTKKISPLDNFSLMFHIHNVHEDWTDMSIVMALENMIHELKINKNKISDDNKKTLQEYTSLSKYKLNKYLEVLSFSKPILDKFLEAEQTENPDIDVDMLSELRKPLKKLHKEIPTIAKNYSDEKIVDIFIQKKRDGILTTNKEIRNFTKIITNAGNKKIDKFIATAKIKEFFDNRETTVEDIYAETTADIEKVNAAMKMIAALKKNVLTINLNKISTDDKQKLFEEIKTLINSLNKKTGS